MMAMEQVSLNNSNSAGIGTHQPSHNIMHYVSLDRQYSTARASGSSKFTLLFIAVKSGATQDAPFPVAMCTESEAVY